MLIFKKGNVSLSRSTVYINARPMLYICFEGHRIKILGQFWFVLFLVCSFFLGLAHMTDPNPNPLYIYSLFNNAKLENSHIDGVFFKF